MKNLLVYLITAFVFFFSASLLYADSNPSAETVKVLYADAQYDAIRGLAAIDDAGLARLGLAQDIEAWLLAPVEGGSRFSRLKFWLRRLDLRFQSGACDESGHPANLCLTNGGNDPVVTISLQGNRMTSRDQAKAALIHQVGHVLGEADHKFLDRVGSALVRVAKAPAVLFADYAGVDITANQFQARSDCEVGESAIAQNGRKLTRFNILRQCADIGLRCDGKKVQFMFQSAAQDLRVTCLVRAILVLR